MSDKDIEELFITRDELVITLEDSAVSFVVDNGILYLKCDKTKQMIIFGKRTRFQL